MYDSGEKPAQQVTKRWSIVLRKTAAILVAGGPSPASQVGPLKDFIV